MYGVLYLISDLKDESALDLQEGYNIDGRGAELLSPLTFGLRSNDIQPLRLLEQGTNQYNKVYLPVRVQSWLEDITPEDVVLGLSQEQYSGMDPMRVMVYVDESELGMKRGLTREDYIGYLLRAMGDAILMDVPRDWIWKVMKDSIVIENEDNVGVDKPRDGQLRGKVHEP